MLAESKVQREDLAYWMCVSALDMMVRRYEAVSLGLKVDGTIRYSPGFSASSSITSRAFMYFLLWATGAFLLKNVSGNFPLFDLYCDTENKSVELNMTNEKLLAEVSVCDLKRYYSLHRSP